MVELLISIHVPRVEDDLSFFRHPCAEKVFQSTSPVWRTTAEGIKGIIDTAISIHVPRVEDDSSRMYPPKDACISIHVPRVEDDATTMSHIAVYSISIHVPRVEDDN